MPTDLSKFSEQIAQHYPTVEVYVLHVRAHERQSGETKKDRISFIEFKQQEDALYKA